MYVIFLVSVLSDPADEMIIEDVMLIVSSPRLRRCTVMLRLQKRGLWSNKGHGRE